MLPSWAPNVHPLIVHFPLSLLLVGLLADLLALLMPERHWLRGAAVGLYVLGSVGAVAAALTGLLGARHMSLGPEAARALEQHEEWGERTAWLFGLLTPIRAVAHWGHADRARRVHLILFLLAAGGGVMLYEAGEHGAELVFAHGVGVKAAPVRAAESVDSATAAPTAARAAQAGGQAAAAPVAQPDEGPVLQSLAGGAWIWNPGADGGDVLEGRFTWLSGSAAALSAAPASAEGLGRVMRLEVGQSPITMVAGPSFDGVLVQLRVNLDDFSGTAMVVHNVQDRERYHFLSLEGGQLRVGAMRGGVAEVLAQGEYSQKGWLNVRLVAADDQARGYVGSDLVAHGHGDDPPAGRVGLRLQGTGTVLIDRLEVSAVPLGEAGN